jgi:hypothetical protein
MSTGGLAVVLSRIPLRFPGLYALGLILYLLNIGAQAYAGERTGEWFTVLMRVLFWGYCAVALIGTVGLHIVMYTNPTRRRMERTTWLINLLIVGVHRHIQWMG